MTASAAAWPPRPSRWPPVLTSIEVCQYVRLDDTNKTPELGRRSVRQLVLQDGFPAPFRLRGQSRFLREEIDEWMRARDREIGW